MNYADIKTIDVQDGDGIRVSIYVSGCHFHCKGCHNKEAWDFCYGKPFDKSTIDYILDLMDKDYITGLSILGGEPLEPVNQQGLVPLVKKVREKFPSKTIWCYTGYQFEKDVLNHMYKEFSYTKDFLENIDIIVDGQFEEDKKLIDLKFRGSTNQKKIDVQASLKEGREVQLKFGDESRYMKEEKETPKQPKILFYHEFKEKQNKLISDVNTLDNNYTNLESNNTEKIVIPFAPKVTIQPVEEKISAENLENEMKQF